METSTLPPARPTVVQDTASAFDVEDGIRRRLVETDPHRLAQRQKDLDKGKNTKSYQDYLKQVPKRTRPRHRDKTHPWTPDKYEICSVKAWQGKVRHWRVRLHHYDAGPDEGEEVIEIPSHAKRGIKSQAVFQKVSERKREQDTDQVRESKKQKSNGAAQTPLQGAAPQQTEGLVDIK